MTAMTSPQDETGTTEAPHSRPDEDPSPNPFEDYPTFDVLESPNLAEEHSIPSRSGEHPTPDRPKEHLSSNHSEENLEPNLSKSIEELLCDFENHQKKQLEIMREITKKMTNKSQTTTPGPVTPTNPQPTIDISCEISRKVQDWSNRWSLQKTYTETFDALRYGIKNDSENSDLMTAIRMCITKTPDIPDISRDFFSDKFLHMALDKSSSSLRIDSHESIGDNWNITNYPLDNFFCTTTQHYSLTQNNLTFARVIHNLIEHRHLSIRQLCEIFHLFVNFPSQHHEEQAQHHEEQAQHHKEQAQHHKEQAQHHKEQAQHHEEQAPQPLVLAQKQQLLARKQQMLAQKRLKLAWQEKLAQQQEYGKLYSHIFKFVLGHAMEWKALKWLKTREDAFDTLQFSFRFFEVLLDDQESGIETSGRQPEHLPQLELFRESGHLPLPKITGPMIAERRSSILMVYGTHMYTPYWTIFNFSGQSSLRSGDEGAEDAGKSFLDGVSHFRAWFILLNMELQSCLLAWQKLLSEMDVGIGLKIDELCNPQTLDELMRDGNDSKRSKFYFVSFSMLRKFADCMEETLKDLENCCQEVNGRLEEDSTSAEGRGKIQEISRQFLEKHRGHFQDLIQQIQRKIGMIMPLQDSLFNSTSIREASEATHRGRYIFVFTMMTIVYLPLGFVTSLFGMNNITENSPLATSMAPFAVTFSVVAAVTYIIASGSFPFANKTKFRPMLAPIWNSFRLLLDKRKKKKQKQLERRDSNLEVESITYPDPPDSSSKSRALKRFFSTFGLRRPQPPEARDVESEGMSLSSINGSRE